MAGLLVGLFCLIELCSYADIIYLVLDSTADNDIVYLKNGKQIKGKVIEQSPQRVKIEVDNDVSNYQIVYSADRIEKVEARLPKKKDNIFWRMTKGCFWAYVGIMAVAFAISSPLVE